MKVLFVLHGYPPELVGGTENTVRGQARGLVRRGVDVVVVAGSMQWEQGFRTSRDEDTDPESGRSYPVHRIHRDDAYFDHWQKSARPKVTRAFREILREEKPDVVHVQHWIRLSRDLVAAAASEGIPAVLSLHDLWTTCLLTFRVQPGTKSACEEQAAFLTCTRCAAKHPPRTPWVAPEQLAIAFAERMAEVTRELDLAREVVVPSRAHAATVERFLGREPGSLDAAVLPPGRDLDLEPRAPLPPPAEHGKLVLGAWGHLDPIKGGDVLLHAIRGLRHPRRVRLHLAGGDVKPEFTAELKELAEGLDVTFHPPFDAAELDQHPVTRVHAMVSGTRAHESWGLVLDEAWSLGLPVVVPRVGAFAERVGEGGGALYPPGDAGALAVLLDRLLEDPPFLEQLRSSVPGGEAVAPSVASSLDRLQELYERAVAAGPPPAPAEEPMLELVRERALAEWDRSLARRRPEELGL